MVEKYGQIDVLVNNAGITSDTTLKKMTETQWHEVINAGRIISVSSINGRKGQFGQCNYSASKSALYGFTTSLAQEVAKKGITVNTISPGYIKTGERYHSEYHLSRLYQN